MGNNRSRIVPAGRSRVIDSTTRARYQNQRELIHLRRKLVNINAKHTDAMSRLAYNQHCAKTKLHELQYENGQRQLRKRMDKLNQQNSTISINESHVLDENDESTLECPSLLVHNLNASNEWEKSMIVPVIRFDIGSERKPYRTFETFHTQQSSKFDTSTNSLLQSESFLISDSLTLKQQTEQMKRSIRIAITKSKRDSNMIARHDTHKY